MKAPSVEDVGRVGDLVFCVSRQEMLGRTVEWYARKCRIDSSMVRRISLAKIRTRTRKRAVEIAMRWFRMALVAP